MESNLYPLHKLGDLLPKPYTNGLYKGVEFYGEGIKILRINDFDTDGNLTSKEMEKVKLSEIEIKNYQLNDRDIVINRVNSLTHLGKAILWEKKDNSPTVYESNMMRIEHDELVILPEFLIKVLHSEPTKAHFSKVAKRAVAQCSINQQDVKSLKVPLPSLLEQKKIVQILQIWDEAIEKTQKLLFANTQQKKALMYYLLSGKKRLLDEHGRRFNSAWDRHRLGTLLKEEKQRNKDNKISRVLSVTNRNGFVLPENQFSKRIASDEVSNYKVVRQGQFGYNPSRINVGSFDRLDQFENGLLSPMYVVFSIKSEKLDSNFFLYWMKSDEAKQRINNSTQGSVRDSVGFDAISSFVLKLPEPQEQRKIAKVLSLADQEIATLQKKLDCLKQEKKALMQQLLTGKKRVKVAA